MTLRGLVFGLICGLWLLFTPLALFFALIGVMAADAGESAGGVALMFNFFTWPLGTILAPIAAAIAWRKGNTRLAWILAAVPLLWLVIPALVWINVLPMRPA